MIQPGASDRPQRIRRDHFFQAFQYRYLRAGAGFRIKSKSTAMGSIHIPIHRRHIIIGAIHFDAGGACNFTIDRCC